MQEVADGLKGYGVAEPDLQQLRQKLEAFARSRLEAAAREAANTALPRMKERFSEVSLRLGATCTVSLRSTGAPYAFTRTSLNLENLYVPSDCVCATFPV